jgi:hypothetical protein
MKKTTKNKENRKMNRRTGAFALALALLLTLSSIIIVAAMPSPTLNFFSSSTPALDSSITILNPQSYPSVGENWTVRFNTTGKANLTITAVNGTTWTNQHYDCYDEETEILTRREINHEITQD